MTTGRIKWFNPTRGYGFIEGEGKDVFLHISALEKAGIETLKEGEEIEFDIGENRGKENAINVRKIEPVQHTAPDPDVSVDGNK